MIILGIDPGLASTGFGAILCKGPSVRLLRCGYIKTSPRLHVAERLYQIYSDMDHLVGETTPGFVAIENVFSLVRYPKAGIQLGSVLGVIYLLVRQKGIPVLEISPKEVKNALVGYGSASKNQIKKAVEKALGIGELESLHASDALAVALTAFHRNLYRGEK